MVILRAKRYVKWKWRKSRKIEELQAEYLTTFPRVQLREFTKTPENQRTQTNHTVSNHN